MNNSRAVTQKTPKGDFFHIFFELIRLGRCETQVRVALLQELNSLVLRHTRLQRHCAQNRWILRLLLYLPPVDKDEVRSMSSIV